MEICKFTQPQRSNLFWQWKLQENTELARVGSIDEKTSVQTNVGSGKAKDLLRRKGIGRARFQASSEVNGRKTFEIMERAAMISRQEVMMVESWGRSYQHLS